jgi:hypothetical protein
MSTSQPLWHVHQKELLDGLGKTARTGQCKTKRLSAMRREAHDPLGGVAYVVRAQEQRFRLRRHVMMNNQLHWKVRQIHDSSVMPPRGQAHVAPIFDSAGHAHMAALSALNRESMPGPTLRHEAHSNHAAHAEAGRQCHGREDGSTPSVGRPVRPRPGREWASLRLWRRRRASSCRKGSRPRPSSRRSP